MKKSNFSIVWMVLNKCFNVAWLLGYVEVFDFQYLFLNLKNLQFFVLNF